jgi:hypothetical protein
MKMQYCTLRIFFKKIKLNFALNDFKSFLLFFFFNMVVETPLSTLTLTGIAPILLRKIYITCRYTSLLINYIIFW